MGLDFLRKMWYYSLKKGEIIMRSYIIVYALNFNDKNFQSATISAASIQEAMQKLSKKIKTKYRGQATLQIKNWSVA